MDQNQSRAIALQLLRAVSVEDVQQVMAAEPAFADSENWKPYGGQSKNWDRVGVQTSEPAGAFAELIINSIDALLMRKAKENNVNERSPDAPQSMAEAVNRWFNVLEGQLENLVPTERTELAVKAVLVGVKRKRKRYSFPTYTIADFGEGQNAAEFPNTLLSLGEKNKEGIRFVQGRYNMGSTGSITFCTQADIRLGLYKFILSKRTVDDSDQHWGWTLVRVRPAAESEDLPVVEYFYPDEQIPRFSEGSISIFGHNEIGVVDGGTVLKLYEYDIGPNARRVDFGLHNALTLSLLECALPVRIYDFDADPQTDGANRLRQQGIAARTFSGLLLGAENSSTDDFTDYQVAETTEIPSLGKIRISASGRHELPGYICDDNYRFFYTVNGQAQAKERKSFFNRVKLGDLINHVVVKIDCNKMDKTARSAIFKPDRQRMNDVELSRQLRDLVRKELQADPLLKAYARKIREARISEQVEDSKQSRKLWQDLLKDNPSLRDLLGMGEEITGSEPQPGEEEEYEGKQFPTFLKLKNQNQAKISLPINSYRRIECLTDAQNNYLGRPVNRGYFVWESEQQDLPYSNSLRNGRLQVTIHPQPDARVGQVSKITFGFQDNSRPTPLTIPVEVEISKEQPKSGPGGTTSPSTQRQTGTVHSMPNIIEVYKTAWTTHSFNFNDESGASCSESDDGVAIYVNMDNRHLQALLKTEPDAGQRTLLQHWFKWGVGVLTLAIHKKFKDTDVELESPEAMASSAIAAHVVTLIRKLGGRQP